MNWRLLIFLIIFFSASFAQAQWLCREASSIKSGNTVTACGVGTSVDQNEARTRSRESAVEEFKRVCELSTDCKDYDYTVTPKRTDCELSNGFYTCFRAIEFEITTKKKKEIAIDLGELERQAQLKNQEIEEIQKRIDQIHKLEEAKANAAAKENDLRILLSTLDQKETDALKLADLTSKETVDSGSYRYLHQLYKNSVKVSLKFWDAKLSSKNENDLIIDFSYERRPLSWLGIQIYVGVGSGNLKDQKKEEDIQWGTPNTTQHFNGDMGFSDLGLAGLIYPGWRGVYLKIDGGRVNGSRTYYDATYNNLGGGVVHKGTEDISSSYLGAHLGVDSRDDKKGWGVFFELGGRKLTDKSNVGFIGGVGINYGF